MRTTSYIYMYILFITVSLTVDIFFVLQSPLQVQLLLMMLPRQRLARRGGAPRRTGRSSRQYGVNENDVDAAVAAAAAAVGGGRVHWPAFADRTAAPRGG